MKVDVFVSEAGQGLTPYLLVLPAGANATVPTHLQSVQWRFLTTTEADDQIIGAEREAIEAMLITDGFVMLTQQAAL